MPEVASVMAWLHIMAVVLAVGGTVFVVYFVRPQAMAVLEPPQAGQLMGAIAMRARWMAWAALGVFVVTGLYLAVELRGITTVDALFDTSFGRTLFVKSLLALVLFAGVLAGTLPLSWLAWARQRALPIMRMNIVVATLIVLLAAFMVRAGGLF